MEFIKCSEGFIPRSEMKNIEKYQVLTFQMSLKLKIRSGLYGDRNGGRGYTTNKIKGFS